MSVGRLASESLDMDGNAKRMRPEGDDSAFDTPPSKVVHVRGLPDHCQQADVAQSLQSFGAITFIVMIPKNRQALVEMAKEENAVALVTFAKANPLYCMGKRIFLNYSKSKELEKKEPGMPLRGGPGGPGGDSEATNILLMTVLNPLYPITTDAIYSICSPFGMVQRIVIFIKAATQVLVEFDSVSSAARAKASLNGADIYAGCCTLRIEYSKAQRLNVRRNDDMTWDYTAPLPRGGPSGPGGPGPMGGPPEFGNGPMSGGGMGHGGPGGPPGGPSPVIMLYGLDPVKMNCERLFNLACLYGNVTKIKFLVNKPGTAMVQFADGYQADAFLVHFKDTVVFGHKVEMQHSKHPFIGGNTTGTLGDGTPACVDFSSSMLNRYNRPSPKNRLHKPSKVVHFFNAPVGCTEQTIRDGLARHGGAMPNAISFFEKPGSEGKPRTGLLEYNAVEEGADVVALCNHIPLQGPTGQELVFKLAFSASLSANREPREHPRAMH